MGNPSWSERLSDSLSRYVGETGKKAVMEGCNILQGPDERARAEWMTQAMDKLDERVPDEETKIKILTECSCQCYEEHLELFKAEYKKSKDIDRLLEVMHGKVFLVKPVREGNVVYITKAPRFPDEHRVAKTPEEKRYYFCHCDYVRAVAGKISRIYCYCGAGWCKRIWEAVLERPVRVDIEKSVLQGDDICRFAVFL